MKGFYNNNYLEKKMCFLTKLFQQNAEKIPRTYDAAEVQENEDMSNMAFKAGDKNSNG